MERACVHIYTGDGKGKTTAAVGLAVRAAGSGLNVWFSQFLKDGSGGEISSLRLLPHITIAPFLSNVKFVFQMNDSEKSEASRFYTNLLRDAATAACSGKYDLVVLDEILPAVSLGMAEENDLLTLLHSPAHCELVLTGRDPSPRLTETADYISRIMKEKHPYDGGLSARRGIEW